MRNSSIRTGLQLLASVSLACFVTQSAMAAQEVVSGPTAEPECFVPWTAETKFFQWPAKQGPYRIALANGYIANTWRIQMIQTAKAYAAQPDVAAKLKEFKVVSTGEDVPAQISAINNFIDSGYDAIVVNAQNPTAFGPVIKRAKEAGVILVAFDNILDTEDAINVNVDQKGLGELWGQWLVDHIPDGGKVLEVRGVAGTSVDTDRHDGIHEKLNASGKTWEVTEVMGKWDDGTAQKATADAIATNGPFVGITAQGGDTGVVQAMLDAGHPMVPFGGETENGFRKFCGDQGRRRPEVQLGGNRPGAGGGGHQDGDRRARGPGRPQSVKLPLAIVSDPDFKAGQDYFPDQSDNFFVGNAFPTCGINFTAQEIIGQSKENGWLALRASRRGGSSPRRFSSATSFLREEEIDGWRGGAALSHGGCRSAGRRPRAGEGGARRRAGPHPRHPRRERRRQVHADQGDGRRRAAGRRPHDLRRPRRDLRRSRCSQCRRYRLHFPGALADPRAQRRRQHPDFAPAQALRPDRPAGTAKIAEEALARAGADDIHPKALVKDLPLSRRQIVDVARRSRASRAHPDPR